MQKIYIALLVIGCLLFLGLTAQAQSLCGRYDVAKLGEYTIQNNVWGASTAQCISYSGTSFTVTQSAHNQDSVASYPSVYKGCHWGDCTSNSGMPVPVSQVASADFSWSISGSASGKWNNAAEAWFSPSTDSSNGYNGGAELMIWFNYQGGMQPAGSQVATVNIGGYSWEVWYSNIGWNYVAYRRSGLASATLNLMDFVNDCISRGYIQRNWYLHDMEAGFELMVDGAGLKTDSFSFNVVKGTQTITPTPTPTPTRTPTQTPTQNALRGDVNRDGQRNINDCLLIAQVSAGMTVPNYYAPAADASCDNTVNINDALVLARLTAGLINSLPCN